MEQRTPKFFRVMVLDYQTTLKIPTDFARHVYKNKVPKELTLIAGPGNHTKVSVEEREGNWFLGRGWPSFVRDHKLKTGEFLVFSFINMTTFKVVCFGRNLCSKNIRTLASKLRPKPSPVLDVKEEEPGESNKIAAGVTRMGDPSAGGRSKQVPNNMANGLQTGRPIHPSFEFVFKEYNRKFAFVPAQVARAAGLTPGQNTVIQDPQGDMWPVRASRSGWAGIQFTSGWSDFIKANKIEVEDTIKLHLSDAGSRTFRAHIYRRGEGRR